MERHGFKNNDKAKVYLDRLLTDSGDKNPELKRRANTLMRQIEARDHALATDEPSFYIDKQTVSDDEQAGE